MIPFTSSMLMGSRSGRTPNLIIIEPTGLTFKRQDKDSATHGINISLPGSVVMETRKKDISEAEWILLETLDCRPNRPLHTGPFLTVQRRRRRRKYVRTLLFNDPTLIDDLSSHQTNFVLDRISQWGFNAFILDNITGGHPLPNLCVHLFKSYGLLEHFNLDPVVVWKVFSIIQDGYHWRNPYHNAVHAADVTQAMHCFLQEKVILEKLTPIEILSALLAAVTHDLDHPGVNQPFLVATSNHLVALYKNSSVLENHHWRSAMGCLNESGMSDILGPELVSEVEWRIRELVLATDITRQKEFLDRLKEYLDTDTLDMNSPDVRHFILQIALKCADISNPCRSWDISRKWSMKVCEEFFRQGDYERQLNLPVTSLCDRYSTSIPRIQTGFFDYVVEPLFKEWHRMMATTLSTKMNDNLNLNRKKWQQLLVDEETNDTNTEASETDETEIPQHSIEDSDSLNVNVAKIAAKQARKKEARERTPSQGGRSVRFDIDTTVTAASESEGSGEDVEEEPGSKIEREFLGIPRPDRRRHSIATGLMGINVPPSQLLSSMGGSSSGGSSLHISDIVSSSRTVGRTVIRRESLPSSNLLPGRALPSRVVLHLQRLGSGGGGSGSGEPGPSRPDSVSPPELPISPSGRLMSHGEKSSCSSTSTVDELLDFTYSLPEPGSRSSNSPRRSILDATDVDELCPSTSILSMSPSVAHVTLQQSISEVDEQRRHLIRQQTCPVVSVHKAEGDGSFNRPRFLSAAAAISPTAVASSSIISQHRSKNKSPEISEEAGGGGRLSGGSSNEGLMQCGVISEEVDRQSGGSSAEASPLEIFVQQFPPTDDNDGEAPRRESGSCIFELDPANQSNNDELSSECSGNAQDSKVVFTLGSREDSSPFYFDDDDEEEDDDEDYDNPEELEEETGAQKLQRQHKSIVSSCTQTDPCSEKENLCPMDANLCFSEEEGETDANSPPSTGISHTGSNTATTSTATSNNRLATLLMWRNNRVWKSLSEEGPDEVHSCGLDLEDENIQEFRARWDLRFSQQTHQGVVGARLQIRRGSAPTTGQPLGSRGAQDRRSDPTHYHSNSAFDHISFSSNPQFNDATIAAQFRRASVPVDVLRQSVLKPIAQTKSNKANSSRTGRRGSLPTEISSDSFALKLLPVFQYSEDDSAISMKRRSSGGPELFDAGQSTSWRTPLLIERFESCGMSVENPGWSGRRRGSLPVEVRIASSVSCSSESESSAGDSSDM